ncbi:MAG: dienelactone hydrolase family protein [Bacteroidetes bacterium]|nr:MAG: dienelactone hydrolase family protein [Bacteroidota bacterium]TAG86270.1 MAG: dienelactone hydrolase family protein [Bacteroidota bacterium]
MKKNILFVLLSFLMWTCQPISQKDDYENAQTKNKACCDEDEETTAQFASLTKDLAFMNAHENPEKCTKKIKGGENITFKTADGKDGSGVLWKATKPSQKYLVVIHEWWGLNDHIKAEAEKFYNDLKDKNINVVAIDLYDGNIATTREEAGKLMGENKAERSKAILEGFFAYTGKKAKIATIGWCFGGGWSLQASLLAQKQAVGCIIYYGMPEKDKEKLKNLKAEVLGIFASQEKWINTKVVNQFEMDLKELKKKNTIKSFDAEHAFANPSNPKYNKEFAEQAYQMSLNFLKKKF